MVLESVGSIPGDVHKHFFRQRSQQLPDFGLTCDTVHTLKIWINNPETDGDWKQLLENLR